MLANAAADPRNLNDGERIASGVGGAALLAYGLARPSLVNTLLAIGGALLLERGVTGACSLYRALGIDTRRPRADDSGRGKRGAHSIRDEIERASDDSFPASDPPSWSPHSVGRPVHAQ